MSTLRKTVLAAAVISTGLLSSAGMAFAGDGPPSDSDGHSGHSRHHGDHDGSKDGDHHGDVTIQKGLINSSDFSPNTTLNLCNNDVPVNVLGIQVPVQDIAGSVPILSEAGTGDSATNAKTCSSPISSVD